MMPKYKQLPQPLCPLVTKTWTAMYLCCLCLSHLLLELSLLHPNLPTCTPCTPIYVGISYFSRAKIQPSYSPALLKAPISSNSFQRTPTSSTRSNPHRCLQKSFFCSLFPPLVISLHQILPLCTFLRKGVLFLIPMTLLMLSSPLEVSLPATHPALFYPSKLVSCVFLHEKPSLYLEFTSVIPLNTWKCNYSCIHICFPCQAEYKILESRNHVYSFWIQHLEHTQNWNIFLVDWQLSGSRSPFLRAQMLYLFWREYCGD